MRLLSLIMSSVIALAAFSEAASLSRQRRTFKAFGKEDTEIPPSRGIITIIPVAPNSIAAAAGQAVLSGTSPGAALTAAGILPPPHGAMAVLPAVAGPDGSPVFSPSAALASLGAPPQVFISGLSALASGSLPMIGAVQMPNVIPLTPPPAAAVALDASPTGASSPSFKAGAFKL